MRRVLACLALVAACAAADALPERTDIVRTGDTPLTLVGPALAVGAAAPDPGGLRDAALKPVRLADTPGVRVVVTVPSLDTPVCSAEARTFNQKATALGDDVHVIVVSRDLPFAQKRFCAAEGIARVTTLSDYYDGGFARAWGLFIKENGLLARAVAVLDAQGVVRYLQIVPQLGSEPDYDAALAAARAAR